MRQGKLATAFAIHVQPPWSDVASYDRPPRQQAGSGNKDYASRNLVLRPGVARHDTWPLHRNPCAPALADVAKEDKHRDVQTLVSDVWLHEGRRCLGSVGGRAEAFRSAGLRTEEVTDLPIRALS